MAWRAWRGGTGRPTATMRFQWRSIRCWSRQCFRSWTQARRRRRKLAALLHDAPEYVIGDMISPFKAVVGGGYKEVEKRLQSGDQSALFPACRAHAAALLKLIKQADTVAAYFEATRLAGFAESEAVKFFGRPRGFSADMFDLAPLPALKAQQEFLQRFQALDIGRQA